LAADPIVTIVLLVPVTPRVFSAFTLYSYDR